LKIIARAASCAAFLLSLAFAPVQAAGQSPIASGTLLDVPYLPQTEALCGGAAAAMLFRYWGDRHASVQQFAPLVDRAAGGIADTALIAAIRERRWSAVRLDGSIDTLRAELAAHRPPMLLIEDRPQRYHYVIAVGVDDEGVLIHDPTWGPARKLPFDKLERAWQPTGLWTLRVTPPDPLHPPERLEPVKPDTPQRAGISRTALDDRA
jgi:ABC-type bacteriocin/lantibiotic exporter with double-glycine peptidase domain